MPSRTSYLLRISGRLTGLPEDNRSELREIAKLLGDQPPKDSYAGTFVDGPPQYPAAEPPPTRANQPGHGVGWPGGFVLRGYDVCEWSPHVEGYPGQQTLINFRVEIHRTVPDSLYANAAEIIPHVRWFYAYRDYEWHRDLVRRLVRANEIVGKKALDAIWFREYQWYCGDGGW